MIGIIGAMQEEVQELVEAMDVERTETKAGMEFNCGKLEGCDAVVVRCGIGKVNAAVCTQILIDDFDVDKIINTGIAGSLDAQINITDVVISEDLLHHDVNAEGFGYPKGQIPRMETLSFKAEKGMVKDAVDACRNAVASLGIHVGRIVSGDQFISDPVRKKEITVDFQGKCTEMEGAAIAQTAYLNNVPFVVIRTISDKADDSASMDYPEFEKKAIANGVKIIKEFCRMNADK